MKLIMTFTLALGLVMMTGCSSGDATNWGKLNPVGVTVYAERGDSSPGDTTVNLDLEVGKECTDECTDESSANQCSPTSCTQVDRNRCIQYGGTIDCVDCNTCVREE